MFTLTELYYFICFCVASLLIYSIWAAMDLIAQKIKARKPKEYNPFHDFYEGERRFSRRKHTPLLYVILGIIISLIFWGGAWLYLN